MAGELPWRNESDRRFQSLLRNSGRFSISGYGGRHLRRRWRYAHGSYCGWPKGTAAAVARQMQVHIQTVSKWRERFRTQGVDGLLDEPRPGQPRKITDAHVEAVIARTLESKPADATHWSTRSMAKATGLNQTAISRIWRAFALHPHRSGELQAVERSVVHRQGARHRRTLSESAGARPGAVRR